MAKQKGKKQSKGVRNDARKNGKAWKGGKAPEVRAAEEKAKREAYKARRAAAASSDD